MKDRQHSRPLALGVVAGAFAPASLAGLLVAISSERSIVPVLAVILVAFAVSIAGLTVVGLPLALWLRSRGRLNAISICVAGLAIGAAFMAAFSFQSNYWPQMNDQSFAVVVAWRSAMGGAIAGSFFGLISSVAFCLGAGISIRLR